MTLPRSGAVLTAVLSGALVLAGCGDSGPGRSTASSAPAPTTAPPSPTAVPSPAPTGSRTVASLEAQVHVTSVPLTDPEQQRAVADYRRFVTDFAVLGGLPDSTYAPVLAGLRPDYRAKALSSARKVIARGEIVLGRYDEEVVRVSGDARGMRIATCIDYSRRFVYDRAGRRDRAVNPGTVPTLATLVKPSGSDRWLVAAYVRDRGRTCA
ncbi:MAG: hypothetical protein JWM64_717 [Frankiales bacterium]|nr:hypothetical protein [Frankiales bacterium]